jgi:ParB family transcriptional regulator, chromosome partitioning protein
MTTAAATKRKKKPEEVLMSSGLGLDSIGDLSGLLNEPERSENGGTGPMHIALDLIDEDPNQPRHADNPGFSKESLNELADTIRLRGVKTPVSLRHNVDQPGRFIINHGARRYRASIIAGNDSIPAFIDNDYLEVDQVIENLQRDALTPREIADWIGRELAKNKKKVEIANELGKSPAFVTQHVTLLDLPEPIAEAFQQGRTNDVTLINELVKAYKEDAVAVTAWLSNDEQELSRGRVKELRFYIEAESKKHPPEDLGHGEHDGDDEDHEVKEPKQADPDKIKKAIVQVLHDGRPARIVLSKRPPAHGYAWLKYDDDGLEFEAELRQVELIAVIEG